MIGKGVVVQLDSFTVVLATSVSLIFIGLALLYFWQRDRRSGWLMWWAVPLLVGGLTALLYLQPSWETDIFTVGVGNGLRIAAMTFMWQGALVFHGKKPLVWPSVLVPLAWLVLCSIPGFLENMPFRVIAVSVAIGGFCVLAAWELWSGRGERLASRGAAVAVLLSFATIMAARIVGVGVMPFPMGALPLDPLWMALFNLAVFVHTTFLGLLLISMTMERLELKQRQIALVDPLTGLMNRRAFIGDAERLAKSRDHGPESTALLVLDLDEFKSINDRFGHDVGDRVLASFAAIAGAVVRPSDRLYRMGGEEFCFVLPDTRLKDAIEVAERVRHDFAASHIVAGTEKISGTLSVGIAMAEVAGFDLEVLLAAADAALYEAKARGRNRVIVADPAVLGSTGVAGMAALRFRSWNSAEAPEVARVG